MQCDSCGSEKDVKLLTVTVGDRESRLASDLCAACVKKMAKEFSLMDTFASSRKTKIWDYDSIPRNTP